jgi:hypothetical protein
MHRRVSIRRTGFVISELKATPRRKGYPTNLCVSSGATSAPQLPFHPHLSLAELRLASAHMRASEYLRMTRY